MGERKENCIGFVSSKDQLSYLLTKYCCEKNNFVGVRHRIKIE